MIQKSKTSSLSSMTERKIRVIEQKIEEFKKYREFMREEGLQTDESDREYEQKLYRQLQKFQHLGKPAKPATAKPQKSFKLKGKPHRLSTPHRP